MYFSRKIVKFSKVNISLHPGLLTNITLFVSLSTLKNTRGSAHTVIHTQKQYYIHLNKIPFSFYKFVHNNNNNNNNFFFCSSNKFPNTKITVISALMVLVFKVVMLRRCITGSSDVRKEWSVPIYKDPKSKNFPSNVRNR